ncbi:MAG: dehydrogenase subunit [Clostridiales bacterium]|jgi:NADH:ubiquinone oxidoreductase subunit E|nr:dehydrogenase subunit [Clostridiales bacterium]
MTITICIGSSCHLKGSREVIQILERLVSLNEINDKIEMNGSFCMGECTKGVSVKIDDQIFSLVPSTTEKFFNEEVLPRLA